MKQYVKLLKGKRLKSVALVWIQPGFCLVYFLAGGSTSVLTGGKSFEECGSLLCYSLLVYTSVGIEDRSAPYGRGSPTYALRMLA